MNLQAGVYVKPLIRQEKSYQIPNRNLLSSSTASRSPRPAVVDGGEGLEICEFHGSVDVVRIESG